MFGRGFTLFRLFGFRVRVDLSWLFLAVLVAWSLAQGLFPQIIPKQSVSTYWALGVGGVIGLVLSIVIHEFSHSLIARRYGLPIGGISLFIFGGVAEMEEEPATPKAEFMMAIAGPIASFALAGIFYGLLKLGVTQGWPPWLAAVLFYLAYLNLILGIFNLLPAYPLDGGRVLRSVLWAWKKDIDGATLWASRIGQGFGLVLMGIGILALLNGFIVSGVWWVLIGLFLRQSAEGSYRQLRLMERLEGKTVGELMSRLPVAVPGNISLKEFFNGYVYKYHYRMFPVVEGDRIVGCMDTRSVRGVPEPTWGERRVSELAQSCSNDNTVKPETPAAKALTIMSRSGNSRLIVVERGRLAGIITARDLLKYIG